MWTFWIQVVWAWENSFIQFKVQGRKIIETFMLCLWVDSAVPECGSKRLAPRWFCLRLLSIPTRELPCNRFFCFLVSCYFTAYSWTVYPPCSCVFDLVYCAPTEIVWPVLPQRMKLKWISRPKQVRGQNNFSSIFSVLRLNLFIIETSVLRFNFQHQACSGNRK